ncbi:fused MFS/spermidine synthase [Kitasatospora sp. MAP5-34]|uniref:spermidine synthase n=1 Tax=Kitasatospora sp. MAP5-34 TaxID=3035102 RepID=UPI002476CD41|nr:fused MFS/spermidine synthase [Kitasatospora sp. MAP5-34]MDH6578801.1 spermidine synthase [Kitasatospora sp. MAP5-34]
MGRSNRAGRARNETEPTPAVPGASSGATPGTAAGGARTHAQGPLARPVDSGLAELVPDRDRPRAWTLLVDGAPQSLVDLDDPAYLGFEYQRRLGHLIDLAAPPGKPITVLHLGGGALTLARYVAATRPRSRQQVAEIDTALTELVRAELPLERGWQIKVRGADARAVLERTPEGTVDLVITDIFAGAQVPAHCATAEFTTLAARALAPGGRYAVNITDGSSLLFARSQAATLRAVFPEVCLVADPAVLRGKRFGNLILAAAQNPLPIDELGRRVASDSYLGRVEHGRGLVDFTAGAVPATDATAAPSPAPPPGVFR